MVTGTDGNELSDDNWNKEWNRSLALMLNGRTMDVMDEDGDMVIDDSFLILVNASDQGVEYTLPAAPDKTPWRQVMDTENLDDPFAKADVGEKVILGGRAIRVYMDGTDAVPDAPARHRPAKTL